MTSHEATLEVAKKVLAEAAKAKFELTPEAYTVWFAYYRGEHLDLIAEVERIRASGVAFSQTTHETLYRQFLAPKGDVKVMAEVQEQTRHLLTQVADDLVRAGRHTATYGGRLATHAKEVRQARSLEDLEEVIRALVGETAAMAEHTRQMEERLADATRRADSLQRRLAETEEAANRDVLTGLNNRASFDREIAQLYKEFTGQGRYFSVLFVDIDFFKKFNDDYGHAVGDLVLQTVGRILKGGVKGSDFPARYGGEEFVVLLPATTLENAKIVAEQLRVKISVKKPQDPETGTSYRRITASFGVAQVRPGDTVATVLSRADKALYLAKHSGRNTVRTELDLPEAD